MVSFSLSPLRPCPQKGETSPDFSGPRSQNSCLRGRAERPIHFFLLLTKIFHILPAIVFIILNIMDITTTRKIL